MRGRKLNLPGSNFRVCICVGAFFLAVDEANLIASENLIDQYSLSLRHLTLSSFPLNFPPRFLSWNFIRDAI